MATLRHLSHWSTHWNRLHLPHTYPYVLFTGEFVGGTIDRAAVRETEHGNHATQLCPLTHWATTYMQQWYTWRNVTAIFTNLVTETRPQQMWRNVTAIYTRLTAETWWQQFFRRLSNCDAPSQLIYLVLLTASLELLGFKIRSRQAISIPKRKVLLVSPLRRLPYRAVSGSICDIVYPLPASAQWLPANLE